MPQQRSPYPVGTLVRDPRLLNNRRHEILSALEAVAPSDRAPQRHVLIHGEARSGRSSVLAEIARRAVSERSRLVVWLRGEETRYTQQALLRHLLTAIIEQLRAVIGEPSPPWLLSWRNRVYLRDRRPVGATDLLSSALVLAAEPPGILDPAIVQHDLAALLGECREAELEGIVLVIDDASAMTDIAMVEELIGLLDSVEGVSLLMAGLPSSAGHFMEAASPCLTRILPVRLHPFRGPLQVFTALKGPLGAEDSRLVRGENVAFLRDVLRLTGGKPYELMLVAHHMWLACQAGEQEHYELTPRVLDRVIPTLALHASTGDALRDGAAAIEKLGDERVRRAVELVARAEMTIRQIAIAQILKVDSRDADRVDDRLLGADIDGETERVRGELEVLQDAGVVMLHADQERFSVVGGEAAAVLLKYKARSRSGSEVSGQPFEMNFLATAGRALARDATVKARELLPNAGNLGFSLLLSENGAGRFSSRAAIRGLSGGGGIARLAQAEIDLIPANGAAFERLGELLAEEHVSIALLSISVADDEQELEYSEVWELAPGTQEQALSDAFSSVTEDWQQLVGAAELRWNGLEHAVLRGEHARHALVAMQPYAATRAVYEFFGRYERHGDDRALARAIQLGEVAIAGMQATGLSDRDLGGELALMFSRVGFLHSFEDEQLAKAREAIETALTIGDADGWVTRWNLANIQARQGQLDQARETFRDVVEAAKAWHGTAPATLLFYLPRRAAKDSLLSIRSDALPRLLELQAAILDEEQDPGRMAEIVDGCQGTDDRGLANAAEWIAQAYATAGTAVGSFESSGESPATVGIASDGPS
jgi:hypothetical protein